MSAQVYPVFLRLEGRRVALIGGGRVAAGKLPGLLDAGARVTVVAPAILGELERPGVALVRRPFAPEDLDGASFVVAAAPPEVNRAVAAAAEERGLFVNAVDDAASASALLGGVVRRGGVTVAVSTGSSRCCQRTSAPGSSWASGCARDGRSGVSRWGSGARSCCAPCRTSTPRRRLR